MNKPVNPLAMANHHVELGKKNNVLQLNTTSSFLDGRTIEANGYEMVNFGSCSYLGLEVDPRLMNAAHQAINKFGVQFSASRSYISLGMYEELESLLSEIFGGYAIAAPSTSMAHMSAIPVLIGRNDAIIMDQQVHASVVNAVNIIKGRGNQVVRVKHNNLHRLEETIKYLSKEYDKVWYMADGIYSMYGDVAPVKELVALADKYECLHLYLDDAHGVSWYGENGKGYVLSEVDFHPKMVLTASLSKSFGAGGGVVVLPNEEMYSLVRNCGGSLMFSGPMQVPVLGAIIESCKLHLSGEIDKLQRELSDRIEYFIECSNDLGLPLAAAIHTPVFYMGGGTSEMSSELCARMMARGFYTNPSGFPAVPYHNSGLRITITRHQTKADIRNFLLALKSELEELCAEEDYPIEKIFKAFGLTVPAQRRVA